MLEKYRYDYSIEVWGNYPSTVQETNESVLRKRHSAGHPIIKQDITEMEKVQLRASRVPQQYNDLSYSERLEKQDPQAREKN